MFNVGDKVVASGNYKDEQLGEFATSDVQTVVEVKEVGYPGTSGQWIKTDKEKDWVDSAWFVSAQQSMHLTCFPQCKGCEYNPCDLANNSDYCPARR